MFTRSLVLFASVAVLAACSSTDDEGSLLDSSVAPLERNGNPDGPLSDIYDDGTSIASVDAVDSNVAPGTQQDLVVNVGDRVFFGTDRYDVDNEARLVLERQANFLAQYPNLNISIEGHADERGTREYNLALGARRAEAAKNYLIALGVDPRRVDTISFGKERPEALGANADAWAQNRRSVSVIK
ncbi:MAG: peptidoglycan-associated lipoprotein Pal [Alphaproteobacteria bacterium]